MIISIGFLRLGEVGLTGMNFSFNGIQRKDWTLCGKNY